MSTWTVPGYTESLELGAGASGRVVLAIHEGTGVPVAVKYLSESLHTRPGFVHDFRAEARLLGGLDSPFVAGLYEYVEQGRPINVSSQVLDAVARTLLLSAAERDHLYRLAEVPQPPAVSDPPIELLVIKQGRPLGEVT